MLVFQIECGTISTTHCFRRYSEQCCIKLLS